MRIRAPFAGMVCLLLSISGQAQVPGLQWARAFNGTTSSTSYPTSVATDGAGNVFTVGTFRLTTDFDPGPGVFLLTAASASDIFVSKLDAAGNFVWAVGIDALGGGQANDIIIDDSGRPYITGSYTGAVDFDPGVGVTNLTGGGAFALRLNADGTFSWANRIGNGGGNSIAIDLSNNLVIAGNFTGSSDFDPGPGVTTLTSAGSGDIFISKFSLAGVLIWVKQMGGTLNDDVTGIATDATSNVYTTGTFNGTADFNPGGAVNNLISAGGTDIFISKLDAAGNFVWANGIGGASFDNSNSIAIDGTGNVLTTGTFNGTVDFNPGAPVNNLTSAGSTDIFVLKLTSAGVYDWARSMGGISIDTATSIVTDASSNVYTTGYFQATADFDPGASVFNMIASTGNQDAFISKLDASGNFSWATKPQSPNGYETEGVAITLDIPENILVTGWFESTVDFDPGACTYNLTSIGDETFVMKLNPASLGCLHPTITGFSPASGPIGSTITINGSGFSTIPANNIVYFGATRANVTAATSTQLSVLVPTGATYQPLSVTVAGLTGYSKSPFVVTFPGGAINACSFAPATQYNSGNFGHGLAVGDLDGDGKTDIAITYGGTSVIQVFRNTSAPGSIDASSFAASVDLPIGLNGQSVDIADIDGDGKLDIIASGSDANIISIYRNLSTPGNLTAGTFAARVDLPTLARVFVVKASDLDGDGKTDIVAGTEGLLSYWRNIATAGSLSAASFTTRTDLGVNAPSLAVADLDVDGKPDLIVGPSLSSVASIYHNISSPGVLIAGSFAAPVNFTVGAWPDFITTGDLDNDQRPEILTSSWPSGTFSILKNTSAPGTIDAGSFAPKVDMTGLTEPRGLAITDFDGDSKPDIALANQISGRVNIYKNISTTGVITTGSFAPFVDFPAGGNLRSVTGADFDGDGKPDLALTNWGGPPLSVLRNTMGPTLAAVTPASGFIGTTVTISGTNFSATLANNIVKFNGTAATVISSTLNSITAKVPVGATTGPVTVEVCGQPATGSAAFTVNTISFNACASLALNGSTDFVSVNDQPALRPTSLTIEANVFFSAPAGVTVAFVAKPYGGGNQDSYALWYQGGALNGIFFAGPSIGIPWAPVTGQWYHIALTYDNATQKQVLYLDGIAVANGTTTTPVYDARALNIGSDVNFGATDLFFNGKIYDVRLWNFARTEAQIQSTISANLSGNEAGLLAYYKLNESGGGAGIVATNSATVSGTSANGLTVGTGVTPVFVNSCPLAINSFSPESGPIGSTVVISGTKFSSTPSNNVVYFGATRATVTSASTTQLSVTVPSGATYEYISVTTGGLTACSSRQFDVTFPTGGTIDACSFAPRVDFTTGTNPIGVVIEDLDGDGKPDLALVNTGSNTVSAYLNTSLTGVITATSFAAKVDFVTASGPTHLAVGDVDGDGKPDFAVANSGANSVSVFKNTSTTGNISFAAKTDFATGVNTREVAIGDLDGDGKPELVVPNNFTKVSVFQNTSSPGTIAMAPKIDFTVSAAGSGLPFAPVIADLDGDAKPDLAITLLSPTNRISLLRNTSSIGVINATSFATHVDLLTGAGPLDINMADLDGDLKPDLVTANVGSNSISIFRNTSVPGVLDGTSFAPKVDFVMGIGPNSIGIGDLDGDSKPDIAVARNQTTVVTTFKNLSTPGAITAGSFTSFNFSSGPSLSVTYSMAVGDLNNDSKPELVITNNKVSVFNNTVSAVGPPTISSFTPSFAGFGAAVTINGTNFDPTPANNSVYFNGVPATVTASTTTSITTTVPAGASSGPVTIYIACQLVNSSFNFTVTGGSTCLPIEERNALIALYNATDGANWSDNSGWLSPDESTWFGVMITGCHVTGLALPGNSLAGYLPFAIGNLPFLSNLDLSANQLSRQIPASIGTLGALINLNLSANQLTGSLPVEISYLSSLEVLALSNNQLSGPLPGDLQNLTALTFAFLGYNQFSGAAPLIGGNSMNMNTLQLQFNQLSDIPDFTAYYSISSVNVSNNRLTFDDLEPYIGLGDFTYAPQALLPTGGVISFIPGSTLTIPFSTGGTANSYQWYKDNILIPGATSDAFTLTGAAASDAGTYEVRVTSSLVPLLTLTSLPYTVLIDPCPGGPRTAGDVDGSFAPLISAPSHFWAVGLQSTGKIITATGYTIENSTIKSGVLRFNQDGSLDNTFSPNYYDGPFLIMPDDKIVVVYNEGYYVSPVRLDANGNDDVTFNNNVPQYGSVTAMGRQQDGKIIVASFNSTPLIERINTDGTIDGAFSAPTDMDVSAISVQLDGYILIGGLFPGGIMRLDPTGAVDPGFNPITGADGQVTDIAIQSDGKIIVVGDFNYFNDIPHHGIVRLNANGSIDNTFTALGISDVPGSGSYFSKILIQGDGKIILAGQFDSLNGTAKKNLAKLNADGTIDCGFDSGAGTDAVIEGLALQPNGKVLISGSFTDFDGTQRYGLARVNNTTSGSCVPAGERAALIALYNSTNGAGWTNKSNWLSADESTWFGVTITGCSVTSVDLSSNNLVGTIPPEIGNFPNLTNLRLSSNHLSGSLPPSISNLTSLWDLFVDNNTLSGPLPANIGNITTLRNLVTQFNSFSGPIPPSFANCLLMENIVMENNQHTGPLPAFLGNMTNLFQINIGTNQLTGIIPPELGNLSQLNFLNLASNNLSGTIPIELGNDLLLTSISLDHNQLTGSVPVEFGSLTLLTFIDLGTNQLSGSIPTQLGNLPALEFLRLSTNQLTGSIPNSFGNLTKLFLLDLNQNQLTGAIPTSFGNLTLLRYLNLYENQLSGSIPIQFGNLVNLEVMDIFTNQLTGTLPKELAGCIKLKQLEVGNNLLTGTLPKELSALPDIEVFQVDYNGITGGVPVEYTTWTKIQLILLSHNQLDAIPTFSAPTITGLSVENNLLDFGDLEPSMGTTGYTYTPQANLPGGSISVNAGTPLTIPFATGGTANQYQWFRNGVLIPGATLATFTLASPAVADAGNYTVNVTNTIVTGLTLTSLNFVVTIIPVLNITVQPSDFIACEGVTATFNSGAIGTTNITYQWQFSIDGITFNDIINGGGYSNATTATLSVNTTGMFGLGRYQCRINGDGAAEVTTYDEGLFINPVPGAPTTTGAGSCSATSVVLSASGGSSGDYRWYTAATGGIAIAGEVNDTYTTPVLSTPTNYFVSLKPGSCESLRTPVLADVNVVPKPIVVTSNCTTSSATLTGPNGFANYTWSNGATTQQINVAIAGSYTLIVTTAGGCSSPASDATVFGVAFCNQPPTIATTSINTVIDGSVSVSLSGLLNDPDNNLDLASLKITKQPTSGAVASIGANATLALDYKGISFAGKDELTIEVCDLSGFCTQQVLSVEVVGEVIVYSGISPNGNGQNDTWIIKYIDALPDTKNNHVSVFNRWGDAVFETSDYDNVNRVFTGLNKSGNELPTGTYFYKIEFASGKKTMTGYLSLKR